MFPNPLKADCKTSNGLYGLYDLYWEKSSSRTSQCADTVCWEFLRTSPAGLSYLRNRVEKWHLQWKGLTKCFFQFLEYSVSFCIIIFCLLNMWKCVMVLLFLFVCLFVFLFWRVLLNFTGFRSKFWNWYKYSDQYKIRSSSEMFFFLWNVREKTNAVIIPRISTCF